MSNENFKNVSSKYNKTEGRTEETKIQELRDFNNWIKMSLINLFCPVNSNILDICGGRGGDIRKYKFKKVNYYVLFDNADLTDDQITQNVDLTVAVFEVVRTEIKMNGF